MRLEPGSFHHVGDHAGAWYGDEWREASSGSSAALETPSVCMVAQRCSSFVASALNVASRPAPTALSVVAEIATTTTRLATANGSERMAGGSYRPFTRGCGCASVVTHARSVASTPRRPGESRNVALERPEAAH